MNNGDLINKLYADYYKKLAYFIKSQIYSDTFADVEDCVQEVFLIVVKKVNDDKLPNHSNILGWLYSIARKVSMKFNSNIKRNKIIVLEPKDVDEIFKEDDFTYQINEDICYKETKDMLVYDMKRLLAKDERDLFEMKFEKKLSNKEISVILDKSEDAIKAKCSRIKQKVKYLAEKL